MCEGPTCSIGQSPLWAVHMPLSGHSPKVKEVLSDKQALTVEQWQSDNAGWYSPTHAKAVGNFKQVFLTELSSGAETLCYNTVYIKSTGVRSLAV